MLCKKRHNKRSKLNIATKLALVIILVGLCVSISIIADSASYSLLKSENQTFVKTAFADDLAQAKADYETAQANLKTATAEYNAENEKAKDLREQVYECTKKAIDTQNEKFKQQEEFNKIAVYEYKNNSALMFVNMFFESHDLFTLLQNMYYSNKIMRDKMQAMDAQERAREQYESSVGDLNASLDAYNGQMTNARNNLASAQEAANKAYDRFKAAQDAAKVAEHEKVAPQPGGGSDVPGVWKSGRASAYGGASDPGAGSHTATGAEITESSTGVSIPMSLPNYRSLFGHAIQIKLGGKTVIGVINDCGGLDGGARAIDVQPGIFHAFGYGSCQAWGVRNVEYLIL